MTDYSRQIAEEIFTREPLILRAYEYWRELRGGRDMPDRRELDPVVLGAKILPHLSLYDLFDGGRRARIRLLGTAIIERMGLNSTGRYLHEILESEQLAYIISLLTDLCANCRPILSEGEVVVGGRDFLEARRILLPVTNGGNNPALCLILTRFSTNPRLATGWQRTTSLPP